MKKPGRMKRLGVLWLMAAAICWMVAHPAFGSEKPVGVVTSVVPLAFLVGELGGERVKVDALVPPGASPHTFEPVPSDMVKLQQARYFVSVGGGFDAWFDKLLAAASDELERVTLITAPNLKPLEADHHHDHGHAEEKHEREHTEKHAKAEHDHGHGEKPHEQKHGHGHAEEKHGHEREHAEKHAKAEHDHGHAEKPQEHGHGHAEAKHGHGEKPHEEGHASEGHGEGHDPHFWLDPIRVRDAVLPVLVEHLVEADPAGREYYRKRADDFRQRLTALDAQIRQQLATAKGRKYVAFHKAWPYFAERYDLEEVGAVQEFAGEEPTPAEVARLVRGARAAGVRYIMVEPQFDPRVARTIANEFDAGTVVVDPLGDPGDPARSTYEGLMRFNASAFRQALGGQGN